jgi:hypothetical protein
MERDTRIPPWAVTTVAVALATAGLIGWGEVRFVRRSEYDLEQRYRAEQAHLIEERVAAHEKSAADDAREMRAISDRMIRIETQLNAIAGKLGVEDEIGTKFKRWR